MTQQASWSQLADQLKCLETAEPLRAQWHAYVGSWFAALVGCWTCPMRFRMAYKLSMATP